MKKAYVKPVFLAEEYELTQSVAVCDLSGSAPLNINLNTVLCQGGDNGHEFNTSSEAYKGIYGKDANKADVTYWQYAGDHGTTDHALFADDELNCDYVWDNYEDNVGVWRPGEKEGVTNLGGYFVDWLGIKFSQFFHKNGGNGSSNNPGHEPGYNHVMFPS